MPSPYHALACLACVRTQVQMRSRDESLLAAAQQALELSGLGTLSRYQVRHSVPSATGRFSMNVLRSA